MKILAIHLKKFTDYAQLRGISYKALMRSMKNPPDYTITARGDLMC